MSLKRLIITLGLAGAALFLLPLVAFASTLAQNGPPEPGVNNDYCLSCHAEPGRVTELPNGDPLYITIDPDVFYDSVHGEKGYACVQCHTDTTEFPHDPVTAESRREYVVERYRSCARCHSGKYEQTLDSVHGEALAAGNIEAAVCTDCHGVHNVQPEGPDRVTTAATCERCHSQVYNLYQESVHGEALIGEGNPDVPTCTDCHGVHTVAGPSSQETFHLFSPQICAECHADPALMREYGISTDVFETYVDDFHGETVTIFQEIAPGQETNKPVCIDCHGVHDMKQVDDPESRVIKENLLDTCQRCHPDATLNFPDSWLGHYRPTPDRNPLVYFVDVFYMIFIPGVLGAMAFFNLTDAGRTIYKRIKERRNG
jgi:hypothetical protein